MFRIAAAALVVACSPVYAQPQCGPADQIAENLSQKYGESVIVRGIDNRGGLVEWWQNPDTGSWTLAVLTPQGLRCLVAAGDASEAIEPEPAGLRL